MAIRNRSFHELVLVALSIGGLQSASCGTSPPQPNANGKYPYEYLADAGDTLGREQYERLCGSDGPTCQAACDEIYRRGLRTCESVHPTCTITSCSAGGSHLAIACECAELPQDSGSSFDMASSCTERGRRPAALDGIRGLVARDALGSWLAVGAWLEAASIHAFGRLARELAAHDAPAALIDGARRAMIDEALHAEKMLALAVARGAASDPPTVADTAPRSLLELARDNLTEGLGECVAAFELFVCARRADDPFLRAVLAEIAQDEARHAELAWAIDRWARTRLSPDELLALDAARDRALEEARAAAADRDPRLAAIALPSRDETLAFLDALTAELA
ncbi:MAG: ferritin-like domain-containing protein [Deltaproteobacteria bacterium]|nr:ferritin-like domain-containing protein [Deltaproteobacteria bacterium]